MTVSLKGPSSTERVLKLIEPAHPEFRRLRQCQNNQRQSTRSRMTIIKQLSAGLIAVAMLSTPAMACKSGLVERHVAEKANAMGSATARHIDGYARIPAPHVIAPAWCDVGDDPFMC